MPVVVRAMNLARDERLDTAEKVGVVEEAKNLKKLILLNLKNKLYLNILL